MGPGKVKKMADRIKRKPSELIQQLNTAIAGINTLGGGWPTSAPNKAAVQTAHDDLQTALADWEASVATTKVKAQTRDAKTTAGTTIMQRVDEATDFLYGPSGAEKSNFGLAPKGAAIPPLHKLVNIVVEDGLVHGSIRFDWENIEGATFEVQWFSDSALTAMVGSATSTRSEFTISGLTSGTQYWMHVRPLRGGQAAAWSDPATRVAPV